ncbi:phosphatidylglycerophosphatase A [Gracilimonas sp.]|uniref:phosphatidylglycerophosphatase A family protein n=1 Tax=Gracilimonas sp. TaxID=1974203 RepID=UPI003BAB79B9
MNGLKYFLGTGCYSGLTPKAPGTAGSLVILPPLYFILQVNATWLILLVASVCSLICFWVFRYFEEEFGKDPGQLVMDEWAGQSLTFFSVGLAGSTEHQVIILLTGFVLFRIFDVLKPLGVKKVQNLSGGWGIFADDLLAGLYALLCLKTLIFVWPNIFGMV